MNHGGLVHRGPGWPAHLRRISAAEGALSIDEEPPSRTAPHTVECVLALDAPTGLRFGQRVLVRYTDDRQVSSFGALLGEWGVLSNSHRIVLKGPSRRKESTTDK